MGSPHFLSVLVLLSVTVGCGDDDRRMGTDMGQVDAFEGDAGPCEGACEGEFPFCDEENNQCLACLGEMGCDAPLVCNAGQCLPPPCERAAQCTDPAAATCEEGHCSPCLEATDCGHIGADFLCTDGVCVEPPPDPSCGECSTDLECEPNGICIHSRFVGDLLEQGYCAIRAPEGVAPCANAPFSHRVRGRASIEGTTVTDFCTLNEAASTCGALNDQRAAKPCETAADCGLPELADSQCINERCVMRCHQTTECEEGQVCWDGEATAESNPAPPVENLYCGTIT